MTYWLDITALATATKTPMATSSMVVRAMTRCMAQRVQTLISTTKVMVQITSMMATKMATPPV